MHLERNDEVIIIKPQLCCSLNVPEVLLKCFLFTTLVIPLVISNPAKLVLYQGGNKYEINSLQCPTGIYSKSPMKFTCACVTGVWGFYSRYCHKPLQIIGGDNYCFPMPNTTISQIIVFGNPNHPFETSLSQFHENFTLFNSFYVDDDDTVDLDTRSSFLTITDKPWTLISSDTDHDPVCLNPQVGGRRSFCLFDSADIDWNLIVKVRKGCSNANSQTTLSLSRCFKINPPTDHPACAVQNKEHKNSCEEGDCSGSDEIDENAVFIDMASSEESSTERLETIFLDVASSENTFKKRVYIDLKSKEKNSKELIEKSLPHTSIEIPEETDSCTWKLNRNLVKRYWRESADEINHCPKSINEAIFSDQLRRLVVTKLHGSDSSILKSLEQMERFLNMSLIIMEKSCGTHIIPKKFLEAVMSAFVTFVREDFFYGIDGIEDDIFVRILEALYNCLGRVEKHNLETEIADCELHEATGYLLLKPGNRRIALTVPEKSSWVSYEPLIESTWKMFLNTHSYCFDDFKHSNDHHHFSVLMMKLFSESIYDKWIEPLESMELYSFILPYFDNVQTIMQNIDYCVAATDYVFQCPAWMSRSDSFRQDSEKHKRKKRSIWVDRVTQTRKDTQIWDHTAYCLRTADEPEHRLGFDRCLQAF